MKLALFIVRTILAIIFLVILYLFALNGRYQYIQNSPYSIDKWTNTVSMPNNWKKFIDEANKSKETSTTETQQSEPADDNYDER